MVVAAGAALALTGEGILWLLLLVGAVRAVSGRAPARGDAAALAAFTALVASLSAIAWYARAT